MKREFSAAGSLEREANRRRGLNLVRTSPEHLMNASETQHEFSERDKQETIWSNEKGTIYAGQ